VLSVGDAKQIEARTVIWFGGQEESIAVFRDPKRDPYCELATDIFGFPVDKKIHVDERFIGKTAKLGLGFTMGADKFHLTVERDSRRYLGKTITLGMEMAHRVVSTYRRKEWGVVQLWNIAESALYAMLTKTTHPGIRGVLEIEHKENRVWFPSGTSLYYPGLRMDEQGKMVYLGRKGKNLVEKQIHRGLFVENFVQKFARDITLGFHTVNIAERYEVVLNTHDEIGVLIPETEAEEGHAWHLEQMRQAPAWCADLPLDSEGGFDVCYSK
jgi:DNA polymerase